MSVFDHVKDVSVKDNKGKSYEDYLTDKDDGDCGIFIRNMKYGRTDFTGSLM